MNIKKEWNLMLSRTLSAAVLLACSAAILPAYAEKANDESARTAGARSQRRIPITSDAGAGVHHRYHR